VNILITGCRGFIGGSLGRFAVRHGHIVLGTGRQATIETTWPGNYVQIDLETNQMIRVLNEFRPEVLVHAAGSSSVAASVSDPGCDFRSSAVGFANVLEAVRQAKVRPLVVLISSAAVVGNPDKLPVDEQATIQPLSPYGFHKAMSELLAREYSECFNLEIMAVRLFSVFGFAQRRLLVWELYSQLSGSQSTAWIEGTGLESRDFLYIEDVASAILGLIDTHSKINEPPGVLINVASGIETNILEIARQIRDQVAPEKNIQCRNIVRQNDPFRWRADITKLQTILPAWHPRSLGEGLALCITEWSQYAAHAS
jgi:UDP-glucose 4-epimerase